MAVVQSAYASRMDEFILGQIVNQELWNATSRLLEDSTGIGYGVAVFAGTADDQVTATPSALFEGITMKDITIEGTTPDTFAQGDTMPLCRLGVIAVQGSKAVAKGDDVYITPGGAFTNTATGNTAIEGATFDRTISAAGLVPVRVA